MACSCQIIESADERRPFGPKRSQVSNRFSMLVQKIGYRQSPVHLAHTLDSTPIAYWRLLAHAVQAQFVARCPFGVMILYVVANSPVPPPAHYLEMIIIQLAPSKVLSPRAPHSISSRGLRFLFTNGVAALPVMKFGAKLAVFHPSNSIVYV